MTPITFCSKFILPPISIIFVRLLLTTLLSWKASCLFQLPIFLYSAFGGLFLGGRASSLWLCCRQCLTKITRAQRWIGDRLQRTAAVCHWSRVMCSYMVICGLNNQSHVYSKCICTIPISLQFMCTVTEMWTILLSNRYYVTKRWQLNLQSEDSL